MEHMKVVELEWRTRGPIWKDGGRYWSRPMPESEVQSFIDYHLAMDDELFLSDIDCSGECAACQTAVVD